MKIIILEKHAKSAGFLTAALTSEGFGLEYARNGFDLGASGLIMLVAPDADQELIADVSAIRTHQPNAYVMVTTDREDLAQRLACYDAGADDCISKPFHFEELVAKLKAAERRRAQYSEIALLRASRARIDPITLELRVDGRVHALTKREAELLALLARADGAAVKRDEVLRDAWGAPHWMTNNSVDVYVGYARRKLALVMADVTIAAVRGVGFKFVEKASRISSKS